MTGLCHVIRHIVDPDFLSQAPLHDVASDTPPTDPDILRCAPSPDAASSIRHAGVPTRRLYHPSSDGDVLVFDTHGCRKVPGIDSGENSNSDGDGGGDLDRDGGVRTMDGRGVAGRGRAFT